MLIILKNYEQDCELNRNMNVFRLFLKKGLGLRGYFDVSTKLKLYGDRPVLPFQFKILFIEKNVKLFR